jgi:hypothetical protein
MSSITPSLELPLLMVDDAHWQKANPEGLEALEYSIAGHEGFMLCTRGYKFTIPEKIGFSAPNVIQVIKGSEQLYATAYEPEVTTYNITADNLVPLYGSSPFSGFSKGQKVIIAIGHLTPAGEENPQPKFVVLWAGVVNIE